MANATSMSDLPVMLAASTTQATIDIDPYRWHQIQHCGFDAAGAANDNPVFLAFRRAGGALTVDADFSEGANKAALIDGKPDLIIPPGVDQIAFDTNAGAPIFQILPLAPDAFA